MQRSAYSRNKKDQIGQNRPTFCVLCAKKGSLKKVHHRWRWRWWQISATSSGKDVSLNCLKCLTLKSFWCSWGFSNLRRQDMHSYWLLASIMQKSMERNHFLFHLFRFNDLNCCLISTKINCCGWVWGWGGPICASLCRYGRVAEIDYQRDRRGLGYQIEGQIFNKFIIKVKRSHSHTPASLITSLIYLALILQRNTTGLGRLSEEKEKDQDRKTKR